MLILSSERARGSFWSSPLRMSAGGTGPVDWADIIAPWDGSICLLRADKQTRMHKLFNIVSKNGQRSHVSTLEAIVRLKVKGHMAATLEAIVSLKVKGHISEPRRTWLDWRSKVIWQYLAEHCQGCCPCWRCRCWRRPHSGQGWACGRLGSCAQTDSSQHHCHCCTANTTLDCTELVPWI